MTNCEREILLNTWCSFLIIALYFCLSFN